MRGSGLLSRFRRPGRVGLGDRIDQIERRLVHLEAEIEGLQDAFHRESLRRNEQAAELRRRTEPEEIARALSRDARRRGI